MAASRSRIDEAFDLFSHQRDGVLKVALRPGPALALPAAAQQRELQQA